MDGALKGVYTQGATTHASKFGVFTQGPCVRQIGKTRKNGSSYSSFQACEL